MVDQRILLTKFGQNRSFGYGARGLRSEEERKKKKRLEYRTLVVYTTKVKKPSEYRTLVVHTTKVINKIKDSHNGVSFTVTICV